MIHCVAIPYSGVLLHMGIPVCLLLNMAAHFKPQSVANITNERRWGNDT